MNIITINKRLKTIAVTISMLSILLPPIGVIAAPPSTVELQITSSPVDDLYPFVNGTKISYSRINALGTSEIYAYDLISSQETLIGEGQNAIVEGDRIIWAVPAHAESWLFKAYSFSTGITQDVTFFIGPFNGGRSSYRVFDADGDKLVWTGTDNHLEMYNFSTTTQTVLTPDSSINSEPKVSGNNIIHIKNGIVNIYNLTTNQDEQITLSGSPAFGIHPDIYGTTAVWYNNNSMIIYSIQNGQWKEVNVPHSTAPSIYENRITWSQTECDAFGMCGGRIYIYNVNSNKKTRISSDGVFGVKTNPGGYESHEFFPPSYPVIFGNVVVWGAYSTDSSNIDIYADIFPPSL